MAIYNMLFLCFVLCGVRFEKRSLADSAQSDHNPSFSLYSTPGNSKIRFYVFISQDYFYGYCSLSSF